MAAMNSSCEKCQGEAVLAAQTRTLEYEGQTLRCLFFVSHCTVCGHQWKNAIYEAVNAHHVERARALATGRQQTSHDTCADDVPMNQMTAESQIR